MEAKGVDILSTPVGCPLSERLRHKGWNEVNIPFTPLSRLSCQVFAEVQPARSERSPDVRVGKPIQSSGDSPSVIVVWAYISQAFSKLVVPVSPLTVPPCLAGSVNANEMEQPDACRQTAVVRPRNSG